MALSPPASAPAAACGRAQPHASHAATASVFSSVHAGQNQPVAPANDLPPDPRNASGKYRSVARRLQQDQPTVADRAGKE